MRPDEPVSKIMTEVVVAIEVDRPVSEILDCFCQYPIHHLPVTRRGRIVGMLSSADVMKLEAFLPRRAVNATGFIDSHLTIAQLMRQPVVSAPPGATVAEAAGRMIDAGVHALPIVDEFEHVLGIVTTSDLIHCLLRGPPRRGAVPPPRWAPQSSVGEARQEGACHRKPADEEYATAMHAAVVMHVEERDPQHLGKALLYLDQRCGYLEKVFELADRFLLTGQDEQAHARLLKAIHAAKRTEERATGRERVPAALD
jgi:CBS domain-containing protein